MVNVLQIAVSTYSYFQPTFSSHQWWHYYIMHVLERHTSNLTCKKRCQFQTLVYTTHSSWGSSVFHSMSSSTQQQHRISMFSISCFTQLSSAALYFIHRPSWVKINLLHTTRGVLLQWIQTLVISSLVRLTHSRLLLKKTKGKPVQYYNVYKKGAKFQLIWACPEWFNRTKAQGMQKRLRKGRVRKRSITYHIGIEVKT